MISLVTAIRKIEAKRCFYTSIRHLERHYNPYERLDCKARRKSTKTSHNESLFFSIAGFGKIILRSSSGKGRRVRKRQRNASPSRRQYSKNIPTPGSLACSLKKKTENKYNSETSVISFSFCVVDSSKLQSAP